MITANDIFRKENLLCIAFADASLNVKGYETSNQRPPAKLFKDGKFTDVTWFGMRIFDNKRCLCFDEKPFENQDPIPATELAYSLRENCFELINNLASTLESLESLENLGSLEDQKNSEDKLDWAFSSLPLSSFYFLPDKSVLLLPQKASSVIDALTEDHERFLDREAWYVHEQANDFGKANFLIQLVYYALTEIKPYESEEVRNTGYKPIPCSIFFTEDNGQIKPQCQELLKAIDSTFKMPRKQMYQVSNSYQYVHQILENAIKISKPSDYVKTNSKVCKDYLQKLNKKSNFNLFLRKKGTLIAVITVVVVVIACIVGYYIKLAITPPTTAGSTKAEIVSAYYKALNELDISGLEDSLARGCNSPDSLQVISLTVTAKTRLAYENVEAIITPEKWIEDDMGAITQGGMVYGVTNLEIEEISGLEVIAHFDFYCAYEAEDGASFTESQSSSQIAKYRKAVKFSFVKKKDWLEISEIEEVECTLQEVYTVPYKEASSTSLLTSSQS